MTWAQLISKSSPRRASQVEESSSSMKVNIVKAKINNNASRKQKNPSLHPGY